MRDRIEASLEAALRGKPPGFTELARAFKDEGRSQDEVHDAFMAVFESRVVPNGETVVPDWVEDSFEAALDCITGWCGQDRRIWPDGWVGQPPKDEAEKGLLERMSEAEEKVDRDYQAAMDEERESWRHWVDDGGEG